MGLIAADSTNSDLGIESRTPFMRRKLVEFAISSPTNKLINYSNNTKTNKLPIKYAFEYYFSKDLIMPKIGFAGFPNETKKYLGKAKNWMVWDFLNWDHSSIDQFNIAEEWKVINIEWFLRTIFN